MSGIYRPVDPWTRCPEVSAPAKPRPLHTDHIPALRGLLALARGNYATVSPEDLQAAVDAGYVHPDVLSCVADELAYIAATDELVAGLQNAAQADAAERKVSVPPGWEIRSTPTSEPSTLISQEHHRAEMRSLSLRQARAEAIVSELKAADALNEYTFGGFDDGEKLQREAIDRLYRSALDTPV